MLNSTDDDTLGQMFSDVTNNGGNVKNTDPGNNPPPDKVMSEEYNWRIKNISRLVPLKMLDGPVLPFPDDSATLKLWIMREKDGILFVGSELKCCDLVEKCFKGVISNIFVLDQNDKVLKYFMHIYNSSSPVLVQKHARVTKRVIFFILHYRESEVIFDDSLILRCKVLATKQSPQKRETDV